MDYRAKIVPNDQPNADGEWIEIKDAPVVRRIKDWDILSNVIPPGYHIVSLLEDHNDAVDG